MNIRAQLLLYYITLNIHELSTSANNFDILMLYCGLSTNIELLNVVRIDVNNLIFPLLVYLSKYYSSMFYSNCEISSMLLIILKYINIRGLNINPLKLLYEW